jgi:4'-phosphopantetheinyl transferase
MQTDLFVWYACLDVAAPLERQLKATLSDEEQARAARFRFDRDRRRFVVARGIVRSILGSMLSVAPERVRFRYGDRGKPYLADEFAAERLGFNVAHSEDHGMFAVASSGDVGVDIEAIRTVTEGIAERFFSPREAAAIRALPASLRETAFFQCWTRKEAYVKALGDGLSHPLDGFDVTVAPDEAVRLLRVAGHPESAADWWLSDLSQLPTYAAAVALKGPAPRRRVQRWAAGTPAS